MTKPAGAERSTYRLFALFSVGNFLAIVDRPYRWRYLSFLLFLIYLWPIGRHAVRMPQTSA